MLPSIFLGDFEGKQHSMVILAAEWGSDQDWSRLLVLAAPSWEIRRHLA